MKSPLAILAGVATLATAASAVTYCAPENNGICYSFSVPESSASSGQGDLFIQIRAPSTMSWVGLAQSPTGMMMGANMLVVYASQNQSSVTLSPRSGMGHVMPHSNMDAKVELLDGSGINGDMMTANIRCSSCNEWKGGSMSFKDSSSTWLFAYAPGSASPAGPVHSNNVSAPISIHQGYGSFKVDLTQAASAASGTNPFSGQVLMTTTSDSTKGIKHMDPEVQAHLAMIKMAHGSVLGLAFGLFFPAGAIFMRLHGKSNTWAIHATIQVLTYCMAIAGMGMGIYLALNYELMTTPHALIGFVVICLLFFMPFAGWIQHSRFCRFKRRTIWGRGHAYLGRALLLLGMINVGTGLQLAAPYGGVAVHMGEIAYGVLAGVVGVFWLSVIAVTAITRRRRGIAQRGDEGSAGAISDAASMDRDNDKGSPVDSEKSLGTVISKRSF